jgi:hypothetical protein
VCALCWLVERIELKSVDLFLYDQVNDLSRRDALRASRGLCLHHTAMLAAGRSSLGVAIISRDLLRTMTAILEAPAERSLPTLGALLRAQTGDGSRRANQIEPQSSCPMCSERTKIEVPLVQALLQALTDSSFRATFEASAGLCRIHLTTCLRTANSTASQHLSAAQAVVWRRLEAELDEAIRKHDHRYQGEQLTDAERSAWRRALALTSGWFPPTNDPD